MRVLPPTTLIRRMWRFSHDMVPAIQLNPRATARNGRPSPKQYAIASRAPRQGEPVLRLSAEIAASVGPRHGVQPIPNTTPSSGAPASPSRG